jgi:hypothetical protein
MNYLDKLIDRMKKELPITNRVRHVVNKESTTILEVLKGNVIENCFLGLQAVDWVIKEKIFSTRKSATHFMNALVSCQIISNVVFESQFHDNPNVYRFSTDEPLKILNMDIIISKKNCTKHPCDLSVLMMEELKVVLNKYGPMSGNYFSSEHDKQFSSSVEYMRFLALCSELQEVDISVLNENERGQFFVNIFNTLFIHGALEIHQGNIHGKIRLSFYRTTCYRIGIFVFSLHDIKHGILRDNRRPHGGLKKPFEQNDPRINFRLSPIDCRIHFVLSQSSNPYLSVIHRGNFEYDLQASSRLFYLNNIKTIGGFDDNIDILLPGVVSNCFFKIFKII